MGNRNNPVSHPCPSSPWGAAETPGPILVDAEGPHHPLLAGEPRPPAALDQESAMRRAQVLGTISQQVAVLLGIVADVF